MKQKAATNYVVAWHSPINIEGVERQPGETVTLDASSDELKPLLTNGYIKEVQ